MSRQLKTISGLIRPFCVLAGFFWLTVPYHSSANRVGHPEAIFKEASDLLNLNQFERADSLAKELIALGRLEHQNIWAARGWSIQGIIAFQQQEYQRAVREMEKALSTKESWENDTLYFDCLYHLGLAYKRLSYFVIASDYLYKALQLSVDSLSLSQAHGVLGNVQRELMNYPASINHHRKSIRLIGGSDPIAGAKAKNNIGKTLLAWNKIDSALQYFEESIIVFESLHDSRRLAGCYYNTGMAYAKKENYGLSEEFFNKTLQHANDTLTQIHAFTELGQLCVSLDSVACAGSFVRRLEPLVQSVHSLYVREQWHHLRADVFQLQGQYDSALIELEKSYDLREQSVNSESVRSINEWETHFQSTQLKESLRNKKNELEIGAYKNRLLNNQRMALGLVALVILVLAIVLAQRVRKEREFKRHKEALLQELNHRVKNNLNSLSGLFKLQLMQVEHKETRKALQDGNSRLEALNLVHAQLEPDIKEALVIQLPEYIEVLVRNALMLHDVSDSFDIEFDLHPMAVSPDQAVSYGLIINEVITNCCKYAAAESIGPKLAVSMNTERLRIADNGPGFPKGVDPKTATTTGLMLIRELSDQLHVPSWFEYQNGLVFYLKMAKK